MSTFFPSFSKGKNANDSSNGHKEADFQKAKTGGHMSKATVLVNGTNQTLYLRDKVGAAYGGIRYKILRNSRIEVSPLQHSFYQMIAYAVEEDNDEEPRQSGKNKTSTDTNLTISSDQLTDNQKITITHNGSKYELAFSPW